MHEYVAVSEETQRLNQEKREKLKDEAVQALPDGYFQEEFDPPLFELQGMPNSFQVAGQNDPLAKMIYKRQKRSYAKV